MKISTKKVYQCEHCKRSMLSAGSMSRHEKFCRYNPNNKHKCFDACTHLQRKLSLMDNRDPESRHSYKTEFSCKKTGAKMYSYLLEKTRNFNKKFTEGLIKMPLICYDHKYMTDSEIEERFHPEDN